MMKHKVIWYSFALLFLCILVLTISVSGQEIKVSPESIKIDLRGGEYNITILTVKWTGSDTIQCFISTDITSDCSGNDSEGIDVTYSEPSPFDLPPKIDYTVNMTIKVAPNLMPGVYTITTNFSCEAEDEEDDDDDDDRDRGGRSSPDIPPVADASAGEPYTGYVGEEITFDGSLSYDPDGGDITSWYWDFGDGTNGTGETTTHYYSNPGAYNITLTVKDDQGYTNTYETTVIIMQANRPPSNPEIDGPRNGTKNTNYTYTAVSTDLDNDTIRYFFDWGDGTNTTSAFLASGITYNTNHSWTTSGIYAITVYAEDINHGVSGTTEMTVFIDMHVQFIDDVIQGYLLDTDNDGIYDIFHNNATGNETTVELQNNGNYLIDSDGDTLWDYEYDPETSGLTSYSPLEEEEEDMTPWYALVALIIMVVISAIGLAYFIHHVKKNKAKAKAKAKVKVSKVVEQKRPDR